MTESFNCKRCAFSSDTKANYNQHIKTKKHLASVEADVKVTKKIVDMSVKKDNKKANNKIVSKPKQVNKKAVECNYCHSEFSSKYLLVKHVKLCNIESESEVSDDESEEKSYDTSVNITSNVDIDIDVDVDVDDTNRSFRDAINETEVIKKLLLDNHRLNQDRNTLIKENKYILVLIDNINAEYRKRFLEMNDTFNNIVKTRDIYSTGQDSDDSDEDDTSRVLISGESDDSDDDNALPTIM